MPLATRGNLVWLGMILSGLTLGAYVLTSWPDTSIRLVPLPYGEAMPKTPGAAAQAPAKGVQAVPASPQAVLTAAEPATEPGRVPTSPATVEAGVVPQESPYELGAQALPGTAPAKPADKQAAATPEQRPAPGAPTGPAAEPAPEPEPAPEEPPLLEIIIGTPPPGQE